MDISVQKRFDAVSSSKTFRNIRRRFDLENKSVLDIGCTSGEFLTHFGPGSVGLTIIPEESDNGRQLELDVRVANIEDDDFILEEKFDVIFANNIFEHMQLPHNFLIKIKSFLKPKGLLILGVPCIPTLSPLMRLNKFRGALASLHINFFTRATLIKTVEYAGWKVEEARGFRFLNKMIDYLLNPIYPHFYVVARPDNEFRYSEKRMKELKGYKKHE